MKISHMKKSISLLALIILAAVPFTMVHAEDAAKGEIGIVKCEYIPGSKMNLLIHSAASFNCVFEHGGVKELYDGEAGIGLGLDLQ